MSTEYNQNRSGTYGYVSWICLNFLLKDKYVTPTKAKDDLCLNHNMFHQVARKTS